MDSNPTSSPDRLHPGLTSVRRIGFALLGIVTGLLGKTSAEIPTYDSPPLSIDANIPSAIVESASVDGMPFTPASSLTLAGSNPSRDPAGESEQLTVLEAIGSDTLSTVTLKFNQAVDTATVSPAGFLVSPPLAVTAAQVDPSDSTRVVLITAMQTPGTVYTLTLSGVQGSDGAVLADASSAQFTAWRKVAGWVKTELWFDVTGEGIQALLDDPRYEAGQPDRTYYVKGFQLNNDPGGEHYGARLSGLFQPSFSGIFDFFINNDDEAQLQLSTDATPGKLVPLGTFASSPPLFDPARKVTTTLLNRTQSYLLRGVLKQAGGDVYLNVAARRSGAGTPPVPDLPVLSAESVSTWINPDLGKVEFVQQPQNATVRAGRRARFAIEVQAKSAPVYYQWQRNRVDIPGAIRPTYITPVLKPENFGNRYRVRVEVAGVETFSAEATLLVDSRVPIELQPIVGINFVGGVSTATGGSLLPNDVAGVVLQEHWNNLKGFAFEGVALTDAAGAPSPITFSAPHNVATGFSGTRTIGDADGFLMQGFVHAGVAPGPILYQVNQVPAGTYQVLMYSIAADETRPAWQSFTLSAEAPPVTYYGKLQSGADFAESPQFHRIDSTDPAIRPVGNYVLFDEVRPLPDGTISVSVSADSPEGSDSHPPTVAAVQLVKWVDPPILPLVMNPPILEGENLRVTWTGGRPPFQLRFRSTLLYGTWTEDGLPVAERTLLIPLDGGDQRYIQIVGQ